MDSRSKYRTKQRDILLAYLKTKPGVHVTAGDVCDCLKERGTPIGQSTVYRQMERLVDEGILNKYIIDGSSPACFEYIGTEDNKTIEEDVCYHCKCEKCGKLIHLHCEELKGLQAHLFKEHAFQLDLSRTVLYGLCDKCRQQ